ncbi:PilX N-terminal domain-containing pilus assembly protein [Lysobacter yangpyeongensis]|uniref:PilX N-terminal domain-containing pilus assembly protein n=2 Tax=Lysobacter yangpyeongensis TaxID=346182 RepID=A0ABW0SK61_9GAMM
MRPTPITSPSRQRGAATLITVLILLLVIALLGLASLRGTLMEERMSSSVRDRGLSFQAAEAALREGELLASTKPALPASGCSKGLCAKPDPTAAPVWEDEAVWTDAPETLVNLGTETARPKFIVELLANNVPPRGSCTTEHVIGESACSGTESRYRITALSRANGRAEVMLQSIYAVP